MKKSQKQSNKKLILSVLGFAVLTTLYSGYRYFQIKQAPGINEIQQIPIPDSPFTALRINSPSGDILNVNTKAKMQIFISSGSSQQPASTDTTSTGFVLTPNRLTAATVELNYDPTMIKIADLEKGDFFSDTLAAPVIDTANKKVTFSFGVNPSEGGKSGSGILATFSVTPLTTVEKPTSMISFGKQNFRNIDMSNCTVDEHGNPVCIESGRTNVYYDQLAQITTNTDIRADNVEGNLYLRALQTYHGLDYLTYNFSINPPLPPSMTPMPSLTPTPTPTSIPLPSPIARPSADLVDDNDTDGDQVNIQDYTQFVIDFGKTGSAGWIRSDINLDGKVDIIDYTVLVKQWGR